MSLSSLLEPDRRWMKTALREAERAFDAGEVPVGAVIVKDGQIVESWVNWDKFDLFQELGLVIQPKASAS